MSHPQQRITGKSAIVSLLTLALCITAFIAKAGAQEALRDSGSLTKLLTIKSPTASSQNSRVGASRRKRRRTRRARPRVTTAKKAAASRVTGKPREIQGVVVDSADSMPSNATEPSPATRTPRTNKPISGGVLNGRAISMPVPPYPAIAKAANASGTVVVRVLIDENGKVLEAQALSGHPLLQRAAEDAARNARFAPTQLSGQPVKVTGVITYNFVPQ